MCVSFQYLYGPENGISDCLSIRKEVFGEEQHFLTASGLDHDDETAWFVIIYEKVDAMGRNYPVGTGRLIIKDDFYKIGRIAVRKEARGKKYGELIVHKLLEKAISLGATNIYVGAQEHAITFYEHLGFHTLSDSYFEDEIFHQSMVFHVNP